MVCDNETNNNSKQQAINDNKQHAPYFGHSDDDTNRNYREYYQNGVRLEAISYYISISPVCSRFTIIFLAFSCFNGELSHAVNELKTRIFYTECR